jgi:hypothetical protein
MILEDLDGLLGVVTAVIVGWDKLIHHLVALYGFLEVIGAFIVEDVMLGHNSGGMQVVDKLLICPNHFARSAILHCFNKDDVAVALCEYHDVLIALAGFLWEPARLFQPNCLRGFILQIEYV